MAHTKQVRQAVEYVRNTNGGATKANFIEDFEPIGELLWEQVTKADLVFIHPNGKISLTVAGQAELSEPMP